MINTANMNYASKIQECITDLSKPESYNLAYVPSHGRPMPSVSCLEEIVNLLRRIIFPGYFGISRLNRDTLQYHIGVNIERVFLLLSEQIQRGICFACKEVDHSNCAKCERRSKDITTKFLHSLPNIRHKLSTDVKATFNNDPAAINLEEVIFCYPGIRAITNHRIAHELLKLDVPLIPRIISEMAHSETGIDIHPKAEIGESFAIDHGTGVVIGATCIIGENVKIYQGVTLGAKSFPLDDHGNPIKGIPRHPIVEDNVVIYAQATILGRITIGKKSMIGGNVWVTNNIPPNSKVIQNKPKETYFENGGGI